VSLPRPIQAPNLSENFAAFYANEADWQRRAEEVQGRAAHAYARLIEQALDTDTGQAGRVAQFVASTFNGRAYVFDLFDLRAVNVAISDDMLLCMDALRWAKNDLYRLVPDGEAKVQAVIKAWGIKSALI
jgi:hypothetical protein